MILANQTFASLKTFQAFFTWKNLRTTVHKIKKRHLSFRSNSVLLKVQQNELTELYTRTKEKNCVAKGGMYYKIACQEYEAGDTEEVVVEKKRKMSISELSVTLLSTAKLYSFTRVYVMQIHGTRIPVGPSLHHSSSSKVAFVYRKRTHQQTYFAHNV